MNRESKNASALVRQALEAREVRIEALEKIRDCLIANLDTVEEITARPASEKEHKIAAWARAEGKAEAYRAAMNWLELND